MPAVHPALDFVLSTVAGHLFCYEAALAIDGSARPLREARAAIEAGRARPARGAPRAAGAPSSSGPARRFVDGLRVGQYDGSLEASTATRVASLLRYAAGVAPARLLRGRARQRRDAEHRRPGPHRSRSPKAIEELTRPIDAIKHQAKTVTVGISRSDETLLHVPLVREVLAAGAPRDGLAYRALRTLAELDPAVETVTGYTRYRIEGDVAADAATMHVVDRGGVAACRSRRAPTATRACGARSTASRTEREVTAVARPRRRPHARDRPRGEEQPDGRAHPAARAVRRRSCPPTRCAPCSQGYQGRYGALKDAVTETEPTFDDAVLGTVPVVDLLTEPGLRPRRPLAPRVTDLADRAAEPAVTGAHAAHRRARHRPRRVPPVPPRDGAAGERLGERLFSDDERDVRVPPEGPGQEPRGPVRREGSRHEGDGRRALEVQAPRRRGRPPAGRRTPSRAARHAPRSSPTERGVRAWHLSLTHTDSMALAVAIAVG